MLRLVLMVVAMLAVPAAAFDRPGRASPRTSVRATSEAANENGALAAAVRDLCNRDVALLGEADHGDGRAVEFKAALVRALVTRCHYNAIFFEAGHYDFAEFSRRQQLGQAVSAEMLSAAVGGLWRYDAEMAPLLPFLLAEVRAGRLALGGMDDQVGAVGALYGNEEMPVALAGHLPEPRRAECRTLLSRRTHWADNVRAEPERSRALACLAEIGAALRSRHDGDRATRFAHLGMVASFERLIARDVFVAHDPADMNGYIRARDRSMYLGFRWLAGRLPPRGKIIIWSANAHVARDASSPEYAGAPNLGALIRADYGVRAFALGFSALAGAHYWTPQEPSRPFAAAAPGSLEARAMAGSGADAAYLGPARLAALGPLAGSFYLHRPLTTRWSAALDGAVVFREERAPARIDRPVP
jgi:erythromycin esterase-like protein